VDALYRAQLTAARHLADGTQAQAATVKMP
jgi:hypothetical protein